jgi:hypothetical protein
VNTELKNLKSRISNFKSSALFAASLILCLSAGCDRRDGTVSQANIPPTSMPELAPRPTTQELLSGPFQKFVTPGIPVSIQAPKGWKISTTSGLTMLEGPSPTQDMMIQLAARDAIRREDVDVFIQHMRREGERQPGDLKHMEIRNQGNAQIIDQLFQEPALSSPRTDSSGLAVVDAKGNVVMTSVTPVHWMVTILVPGPKAYDHYDIDCIGLTTEEYAADKELLEKIMGSIVYEESLSPTAGPL